MADGMDTPFSGPMTMQEALSKAGTLTEQALSENKQAETEEAAQEPEEESQEVAAEATDGSEAEASETESVADESETADDGPQVLTAEEYGEVLVDVGGEATPLSELIKGNLRQADYTRKRQAESAEAREAREALDKRSAELDAREQQLMQALAETEPQEPDWEALAEEDPLGVTTKRIKWEKDQAKRKAAREQADQKRQQDLAAFRQKTVEAALNVFPEWAENGKFDQGVEGRKAAALAAGFTLEEYSQTQDFRVAALLEKARLYDEMVSNTKAKVAAVEKKIAKAPKVLKPGASKGPSDPAAERRAAQQKRFASGPISSTDIKRMIGR